MPRDLSHIIIADEVRSRLPQPAARDVADNEAAFHMGAIAVDSFLYGSSSTLATRLHGGLGDDTRDPVLAMLDDARAERDPETAAAKRAFAFGYLTHVGTDIAYHPMVYSMSGSQAKENNLSQLGIDRAKARHRFIETWIDRDLMDKRGLSFDTFKPLKKIRTSDKFRPLCDFFAGNVEKALGLDDSVKDTFRRSMRVQILIGRVTQSQPLRKLLDRLDRALDGKLKLATSGFYRTNRTLPKPMKEMTSFVHPVTGEVVHKNLDDLHKDAVANATRLVLFAREYLRTGDREAFKKSVKNVNLDTGVENTLLKDVTKTHEVPLKDLIGEKVAKFMEKTGIKRFSCGVKAKMEKTNAAVMKRLGDIKRAR